MAKQFKFDGLIKQAEQQKAAAEQKTEPEKPANELDIKQQIVIKDEFKFLIPPLMDDEYAKLEESILAEGCRDPLVVWKNGSEYVLIDGHNRYAICSKNNLNFNIQIMEFENSELVMDWMVNNQLGKRNVTDETKSYLRGMQYNREKKKIGENQYTLDRVGQNVPALSTADKLAQVHKVSEKTIKRDEKYAEAINKLVGDDKTLKFDILNRKLNLPKGSVMKLADEADELVSQIGKFLKEGVSFNQALQQVKPAVEKESNNPHKEYLKDLRNKILMCLDEAIKQNHSEPLEELHDFLQEFSKALD
ncbi:MAG: ParB N-terminal domain-containing protein [Microscillaceae bacterium]|jgi:hypothetical protein|nr:ParB N-terminal domain-containing protein [Microscillaceae bacterium]